MDVAIDGHAQVRGAVRKETLDDCDKIRGRSAQVSEAAVHPLRHQRIEAASGNIEKEAMRLRIGNYGLRIVRPFCEAEVDRTRSATEEGVDRGRKVAGNG